MAAVATQRDTTDLIWYLNLKLAALGQPTGDGTAEPGFLKIAEPLLRSYETKDRLLRDHLCPCDTRIQAFLNEYLNGVPDIPRLPARTMVLDRPGLARVMSLPPNSASFSSPFLRSYRVPQGVLHNPRSDRRTTKGVFHIAEGGFPVPADKVPVPNQTFAALLRAALAPPDGRFDTAIHSGTRATSQDVRIPAHSPAGLSRDGERSHGKRREDHGDPLLRAGQPGQQPGFRRIDFRERRRSVSAGKRRRARRDHWTGHTGCVILAPHLAGTLKKAALGLPHKRDATERQRRDGMCWKAKTNSTTTAARSRSAPRRTRGDRDAHRRQLLRLLQEGSEDADQLRRESVRPVRGRTRRRRDGLRHVRPGPGFPSRAHVSLKKATFERDAPAGRYGRARSRRATRSTGAFRRSTTSRKTRCSTSATAA